MIVCTFAAEYDNCYKLMKNLLSSQFRALVAIIVGLLLITFHEETVRWITILIGVMSSCLACSR